ncbi:hypothetical protein [Streptomyces sp. NPDC007110]|uniref:hypothetical protein n=1 Tax=Streptomyces sp. NPDC007110 TaxID=3156916 RepID=UPI0033F37DFD
MSRALQHQLHSRLELATQMLDLPLTAKHLEDLAAELTPAVKALLAEQADQHTATAPIGYAVVGPGVDIDEAAGVQTTTYAQCTSRIDVNVDLGCPAALLADELRMRQPDVVATDVPSATYLGLTVRPQSLHAWRWWLDRLHVAADGVTYQGDSAYGIGTVGDVAVHVRGDGVPELAADHGAARLEGLLAETGPAQS